MTNHDIPDDYDFNDFDDEMDACEACEGCGETDGCCPLCCPYNGMYAPGVEDCEFCEYRAACAIAGGLS